MSYLGADRLFPEFDVWTQFIILGSLASMEKDALQSSHPIEAQIVSLADFHKMFDIISYFKGASILRMLYDYVGNEAFMLGMKTYLEKFSYQNVVTNNLWTALEDASNKPVEKIMSMWTTQMGFPLITASKLAGAASTTLCIKQEKFGNSLNNEEQIDPWWIVPIKIKCANGNVKEYLLEETSMGIIVEEEAIYMEGDATGEGKWYKVNPDLVGYYRVFYKTSELMENLRAATRGGTLISMRDRLTLLDDMFALAQFGYIPTVDVLKQLITFTEAQDSSYAMWKALNNWISKLERILVDCPVMTEQFKSFVVDLMEKVFPVSALLGRAHFGEHQHEMEQQSHTTKLLRSLVFQRMGCFGHKDIVTEAQKQFSHYISTFEAPPADLKSAIYHIAAATHPNPGETFQTLLNIYQNSQTAPQEKVLCVHAMASIPDKAVLKKLLQFSLKSPSEAVRKQDIHIFLWSVSIKSPIGAKIAWQFFQENYAAYKDKCAEHLIPRIARNAIENLCHKHHISEANIFFQGHSISKDRDVLGGIEKIHLNATWRERDGESIANFLETYIQDK